MLNFVNVSLNCYVILQKWTSGTDMEFLPPGWVHVGVLAKKAVSYLQDVCTTAVPPTRKQCFSFCVAPIITFFSSSNCRPCVFFVTWQKIFINRRQRDCIDFPNFNSFQTASNDYWFNIVAVSKSKRPAKMVDRKIFVDVWRRLFLQSMNLFRMHASQTFVLF